MSIKNSYINGTKKITMNSKIFHAFNTFMFLRIKVLLATEWQACDEIISVLQKVAAESKQFEDSYKDLEYTAVTIDNFTGDLHELFKVCTKSLQMNKPDDIVTVIEIRRKAERMNGFKKFIPEIATCLQIYSTKNFEQEYFTKNICTVVRTMKYAELHGFEMVNAKICAMKNLYNSIQDEFIRTLHRHITFAVEVYLNESAYIFVTKKILNKMHTWEIKNNYKCVYESAELKGLASEFWQTQCNDLRKLAIEKIYNSIVSNEKEFCENLFDEVSEKVLIGQTDNVYNYFDIRSAVQKLYGNGYIYILKNGISIGLENAIEIFLRYNNYDFTDVYDDYREWLNRIKFIKDITPYLDKPEELVEEYRLQKGVNCLELLEYIQNILIVEIPEYNYSSNLFKVCEHDIRRVRIIVNEGVTPRSLPLLMTILKNCLQILECKDTQHIFINLSRSIDLSWILHESNEIGFKERDTTFGIQSKGFQILKGDILTKKKGIIEACRSNVATKTDESLESTVDGIDQPCKIIYEITNKENADCDHKTPRIIFQVEEYVENQNFFKSFLASPKRKKTIKITLKLKSITHEIYIETFMGESGINIKQTSMKNQKYEYSTNSEFYYYHEKDDPEFVGLSAKQLPNLYTYLQTMRTLDDTNAIPKFSGYNLMVCAVDKLSLVLSCETPNELNVLVSTILDNSRDAIIDYYALKIHDHIVSLEFQLSEFLARRINIDHWTAITSQFLPKSYMKIETLSNLIQEFLLDRKELDVINEQDLAGLKTCDYKIGIYAIVRENRNTLIYMMMKECKTDFAYSPMSKVNNIYFNLLRDQEYYKKSHPLNMSNLVLPTHPISYMYKAFFDPNSNLLNMLDMDLKYDDNKDTYEELSNKIACYIHEDVMKESSNENGLNMVKASSSPTTASLQEALKYEVFLMIEKIKLCRQRINSSAKVKIQVSSMKEFAGDDIEEINELKAILLQSQ